MFGCEAEPIPNPGKLESIRFRSGHNRRAAQRGSDQACGLRDHNNTDLLGTEEIQGRLKQKPKRHRLTVLLCLTADPGAEWLRIRSMARAALADLNPRTRCSTA